MSLAVDARDDLLRSAELLLTTESVVELRALKVDGVYGSGTLSGYFNDAAALVDAAQKVDGKARGVFVTLNPVDPALLARANNRVKKPDATSSDSDITRRRWLMVDLDPTRPSGISSTDAEKSASEAVMKDVGRYLRTYGFANPVVADSGNGYHLLYRVDLLPEDGGLIKRCLEALAFRFDTDAVTIDQAVSNPARMTKLYGTLARKGDATGDRPHRRSRLMHVPQPLVAVDQELLEQLGDEQPMATVATAIVGEFNVDDFLRRNGLAVGSAAPWRDGRKWVLSTCPFDSTHTDGAAYVVQHASGAIAAGCHHNGCTGKSWADLRQICAPARTCPGRASVSSVSASLGGFDAHPWPEPEPLPTELLAVAPFDPAFLPQGARRFVEDIAERMQCPLDFPGISLVIAFATVVGRRVGIRPKRLDDWVVVPNLWGMVIGRPSIMKSPAIKQPLGLLMQLEREARVAYQEAMAEYEAARFAWQSMKAALQRKGVGASEARAYLESEPEEPVRTRYVVNDTSVEKLGEIQSENPNGLLQFRDELIGFLRSLEKDNQQHARAYYLEAWDGTSSFTYDRIARGTIDIPAAIISVLGGIQPGPLASYYAHAVRGGSGDDGFLQRFQLGVWPDATAKWTNIDRLPDSQARDGVLNNLRRLCACEPEEFGAVRDADDDSGIPYLRFAPDAQDHFDEWRTQLEGRLRGDEHPAMESHLAKFRSLIPSLALLFHLADGGTGPVPLESLERSIAMGAYLETHARRLYSVAANPGLSAATRLLAKITSGALPREFTLREVYRKGWSGLGTKEDAEPAASLLEEYGWLRAKRVSTAGAPKDVLVVNPRASDGPTAGTDRTDTSPADGATAVGEGKDEDDPAIAGALHAPSDGTDITDRSPSVGSVSAEPRASVTREDQVEPPAGDGPSDSDVERGLGWSA